MRFVTYRADVESAARLGVIVDDYAIDVAILGERAGVSLPYRMLDLIDLGRPATDAIRDLLGDLKPHWRVGAARPLTDVTLLAPIPRPRKNIFGIGLNYVEHVAESATRRSIRQRTSRNSLSCSRNRRPPSLDRGSRWSIAAISPSSSTGRSNWPSSLDLLHAAWRRRGAEPCVRLHRLHRYERARLPPGRSMDLLQRSGQLRADGALHRDRR